MIKYTLGNDGYVNNFVTIGELEGSKTIAIENFDSENFDCYKEVEGGLVFDEQKLQEKLNPPLHPVLPTLEERLSALESALLEITLGGM